MALRDRTGVRFVLTNSADPAAGAWYDTYARTIARIGPLANAVRFENPAAVGTAADPRFAALYDIVTPDPADAWPVTENSPDYPTALFDDPRSRSVIPEFRGSYALVGSRTTAGEHGRPTAVYVVLSDGSDDTARAAWAATVLDTGGFHTAARFRLIEGHPEPAEWLDVLETDTAHPIAPAAAHPATGRRFAGLFRTLDRRPA
ncbi:MAG TPA: hypothetical protein VHF06_04595 [Pseudonocardiaceae bacterium]|nr:hypothetical protein [Pseudonocardiaceae bacterium]